MLDAIHAGVIYSLWANLGLLIADAFIVWNWRAVFRRQGETDHTSDGSVAWFVVGLVLALLCLGVMTYGAMQA